MPKEKTDINFEIDDDEWDYLCRLNSGELDEPVEDQPENGEQHEN